MNNKLLSCLIAGALATTLALASPALARGGGGGHGGGTSRGGDPIGVQVTAHQVLGHDPSFAATGHIEAIGHVASPFDIRGVGTDWHLV